MNDPVFGKTWTLSKEASNFIGTESPDSETRFYEELGDGYRLTVRGTRNGEVYEWGYVAEYDGKRCPVYGRPDVDSIEKHKVTDQITIGSFTKEGRIVASYRREVTADGTNLTVVASGHAGAPYFDVIRYQPVDA